MAAMAEPRIRPKPSRFVRGRLLIQAAFLLVWLDPLALRLHNICGSVYHCYACPLALFACPVGVLANFSALHVVPFIALGTLLVVGGVVGGFVCGWACPFGFLQDLAAKVPTPKVRLPSWIGYFRYAVLAGLVVAVPYFFGEAHPLFICRVCPAGALEGAVPNLVREAAAGGSAAGMSALKWAILVLFAVAMFVKFRPWCSLFCPLGAIFGVFNRFSAVFLRVNPKKCVQCGACRKMCPVNLAPEKQLADPLCIRCMECTRCEAIEVKTAFSRTERADPAPDRQN